MEIGSGKMVFTFDGGRQELMRALNQEGEKLGKKREYKKMGLPIAFGTC